MSYTFQERLEFREKYKKLTPGVSPYSISKWGKMSPIEELAWQSVRFLAIPAYPEYPIGRYFVDLADIEHKIVFEIDGRKWHTVPQKDILRQSEIEGLGWTVYRFHSEDVRSDRFEEFLRELYYGEYGVYRRRRVVFTWRG